jgi:hypothetical protein
VLSGAVSSKVRVHSRSWFFTPPEEEIDGRRQTADGSREEQGAYAPRRLEEDGNGQIETYTRIRVPRDAVKIQDRLHYILQPPIESSLYIPTLELPVEPV